MSLEIKKISNNLDLNFSTETLDILQLMIEKGVDPINLVVLLEEIKVEYNL